LVANSFSVVAREQVHGARRELLLACLARVVLGLLDAVPAEHRHELMRRGAVFRRRPTRTVAQSLEPTICRLGKLGLLVADLTDMPFLHKGER
jgi:hypothetical protein